jgi:transcriptional regulator with XRE-family HTH domain
MDRGLLQRHLASLFGCSTPTVQTYETGRAAPDLRHWPAILRFLGYDPRPEPRTFAERLRHVREGRGMSQGELGAILGIQQETMSRLERAESSPSPRIRRVFESYLVSD